ncbi:MAG: hypothetical protein PHO01_07355 [Desulfotomaculaceae bacterium]|nr:hypothetical protein [Desulfotomaculaceae bacterium]
MLKVYTSIYRYNGPNRLDITVKTGDRIFAPTWKMVMQSKAGKLSQQEYAAMYYSLMRDSYVKNKQRWVEVLNMDQVVLVCFCPKETFCHRLLLADILTKLGAEYLGEI